MGVRNSEYKEMYQHYRTLRTVILLSRAEKHIL